MNTFYPTEKEYGRRVSPAVQCLGCSRGRGPLDGSECKVVPFIKGLRKAYNSAKQLEFVYFYNPFIFCYLVGFSGLQMQVLLGCSAGPGDGHAIDMVVTAQPKGHRQFRLGE